MELSKKYLITKYEQSNEHVKVSLISSLFYFMEKSFSLFPIELYGHNQLPKICFTVVKKRHNTRFFNYDKQSNQMNNVQPGDRVLSFSDDLFKLACPFQGRLLIQISTPQMDLIFTWILMPLFKEHRDQRFTMCYTMILDLHRTKSNN